MTLSKEEILVIGCHIYYHPSQEIDCMVCEKAHAATPNCAAVVAFINKWTNIGGSPPIASPTQLFDIENQYLKIWQRWKYGVLNPNEVCISIGPPGSCRCSRCVTISKSFTGINDEDDDESFF